MGPKTLFYLRPLHYPRMGPRSLPCLVQEGFRAEGLGFRVNDFWFLDFFKEECSGSFE